MLELSTLIGIALKTSLLVAGAGIAAAAFAKASAAHRHLVWTAVLALAVLMPVAVLYAPTQILIPVAWPVQETLAPATHMSAASAAPAQAPLDWSALLMQTLLAVWAAGTLALLLRDAAAHVGLMRWRRRAGALSLPAWTATVNNLARVQQLPRRLTILQSAEIGAPCTWGVTRPVLLLPLAGENWTETERRHAVVHELAHIRRHDYLSALIARLCCAVHWYNPLVWFAAAQVRRLQEQAADDAVLRAGGLPSEYAQLLVNIAVDVRGPVRVAMGIAARSALRGRVLSILGSRGDRVEPGVFVIFGVLLAMSCLMFFIATAAAAPPNATRSWIARSADAADDPALANASDPNDDTGPLGAGHSSEPVVLVATRVNHHDDEEHADDSDDTEEADEPEEPEAPDTEDHSDVTVMPDMADAEDAEEAEDVEEPEVDEPEVDEPEEPEEADEPDDVSMHMPVIAPTPPTPPAPPQITVRHRRMVVRVPAVPAVTTPAIPGRTIVVNVPAIAGSHYVHPVPAQRIVVRVPAVRSIHVPGQPARNIVVRVPVVRVRVPSVPSVPAVPAVPAVPSVPAVPAAPAAPATPPDPPSPPEPVE